MLAGFSVQEFTARDLITARFLRMLSIILEQLHAIVDAHTRAEFGGLGKRAADLEKETDILEQELEETCLDAFSRGTDLSLAVTVFRSLSNLERVGDYAFSVARDLESVAPRARSAALQDTLPMVILLARMVEKLAYAFAERNSHAATKVIFLDEQIDALYEQMHRASVTRLIERPEDSKMALVAARMARNLERLGDHLVNVSERLQRLIATEA